MTIALGMLGSDGFVLAADEEISTGGDIKGVGSKLVCVNPPGGLRWGIGIGGAGLMGYFQALRMPLAAVVGGALQRDPFQDSELAKDVEGVLLDFHIKHVAPYSPPPEVSVLIGACTAGRSILLASEKSAIRHAEPEGYTAIGAGSVLALDLIHGYHARSMPVDVLALLACYVTLRVRASIEGCGQGTQLLVMCNSGFGSVIPGKLVKECEALIDNYAAFQTQAFYYAAGFAPDSRLASGSLRIAKRGFDRWRQGIRASISDTSQI